MVAFDEFEDIVNVLQTKRKDFSLSRGQERREGEPYLLVPYKKQNRTRRVSFVRASPSLFPRLKTHVSLATSRSLLQLALTA